MKPTEEQASNPSSSPSPSPESASDADRPWYMIERRKLDSDGSGKWLIVPFAPKFAWRSFTDDATKATRFADRVEAERVMQVDLCDYIDRYDTFVSEHLWMGSSHEPDEIGWKVEEHPNGAASEALGPSPTSQQPTDCVYPRCCNPAEPGTPCGACEPPSQTTGEATTAEQILLRRQGRNAARLASRESGTTEITDVSIGDHIRIVRGSDRWIGRTGTVQSIVPSAPDGLTHVANYKAREFEEWEALTRERDAAQGSLSLIREEVEAAVADVRLMHHESFCPASPRSQPLPCACWKSAVGSLLGSILTRSSAPPTSEAQTTK